MNNRYLYWTTFVAINGGLIFGLNMAGIAGANDLIANEFELGVSKLGTVASFLMLGCLIGALFAGNFIHRFGPKKVMIGTAVLFLVSSLGCALAQGFTSLTIFRVLSGLAVGATSVVTPMYISEISPAPKRGMLVSFNQFAITVGIVIAYIFDYFLLDLSSGSWRYMLAVPALFSVIYLIFLLTSFCESPRWLLEKGHKAGALTSLQRLRGTQTVTQEIQEMEIALDAQKSDRHKTSFGDLFRGKTGKIVLIGTLLAAFQQITGINAVIIFAPDIFKAAGVGGEMALLQAMLVGVVNVLMTVVALRLVDTKGRKTLLIWGAVGMLVALTFLTYSFWGMERNSVAVLLALLVYISFFAASYAPVMWVIISEIYPSKIKGVAMSFSTAVSWGCTFVTVYFAPIIRSEFGDSYLFAIFGGLTLLSLIFVKIWIPETKGKTLEQIETELGLK